MSKERNRIYKITAGVMTIALMMGIMTGCGSGGSKKIISGVTINKECKEEGNLWTIKDKKVKADDENTLLFLRLGVGLVIPDEWEKHSDYLKVVDMEKECCVSLLPQSLLNELANKGEDVTQEEIMNVYENQMPVFKIMMDSENKTEEKIKAENKEYKNWEKIVSLENKTFYLAYNEKMSKSDNPNLSDEDIEEFQNVADTISKVKENIIIFPGQKSEASVDPEDLQNIKAKDAQGNTVTSNIFEQYDLTMINIWSTWCAPCVEEMPMLEELYKNLPENVNMISICADGTEEKEEMNKVLKEAEIDFTTLVGTEEMRDGLLHKVFAYPTTIFVDKNGNTVGETWMGPSSSDGYMKMIEERLGETN